MQLSMTKNDTKEVKEILSKDLDRSGARLLLRLLFNDSYFQMGLAAKIQPQWLREQLTAVKIFTKDSQELIKAAALKMLVQKPKSKFKRA